MRAFRSFAVGLAIVAGGACAELKTAPPSTPQDDAGADATSPIPTDGAPDAFARPDADALLDEGPLDSECSEPWTKTPKAATDCAPRRVALVEQGLIDVTYVSIARTSTAR